MRGEWLRQCLKTFLFSGCVPFHNNGGCGVEEAMSLDQILKSVLWSLRRQIHPTLPTQTKLKFFPAEEMSHGLSITRNFILMLCIKIASRFWNDYNEFVYIPSKVGENMFRVYFISLVTVMTTTSLPSKLSKMLKDNPAWDKRRFVLVRWWKQAKQDFFHTSWGWGPLFPHASIFANLRVSLSP